MIENAAHNGEAFIWLWFENYDTNGLCVIICLRTRTLFKVIPWEVDLTLKKKLS